MSRGALRELVTATPDKFGQMILDMPPSEKKEILKTFQQYASVLGDGQ